jgi:GMP synthase-like glutamine amidotransferase
MQVFRHEEFEDEAAIGAWARARGWEVASTLLYAGQTPPAPADYDWLVVMGGSMNIYEDDRFPWLEAEKRAIALAIEADRVVLGVCLGAQLMADVLGGPVTRGAHREIGWLPVCLSPQARTTTPFAGFPESFTAFHWHGDTFAIPPGAAHAAFSAGCANQAFVHRDKVVGLQFHLETTAESMDGLIAACAAEMADGGEYVQDVAAMRAAAPAGLAEAGPLLARLLDNLAGAYGPHGEVR